MFGAAGGEDRQRGGGGAEGGRVAGTPVTGRAATAERQRSRAA